MTTARDDNADDSPAHQHHAKAGHGPDRSLDRGLRASGGQVASRPRSSRRLPLGDRSFDRNEQHRAALGHHSANTACPRHAVGSRICLHLLIAGSHVEVPPELPHVRGWCCAVTWPAYLVFDNSTTPGRPGKMLSLRGAALGGRAPSELTRCRHHTNSG